MFCEKSEDVLREISLNTGSSLYLEDAFLIAGEESRLFIDVEETEKHLEVFQTLKESFLKAYNVMDRELKSYTNIDCFCSGATAVTLVKQSKNLVIDNIGDSRVVLATRGEDDSLTAVQLTVDLKTDLPDLKKYYEKKHYQNLILINLKHITKLSEEKRSEEYLVLDLKQKATTGKLFVFLVERYHL
ncbi:probable protein phosphatase 2C 33 isoform X1 [Capsicum annuum]|uniref:probable protein phosphatase 2C 33 isoform X1 n=1 Tax=Capsicum annuum TaxID=4072 RepID=UPI0007BEDAD6|nr:probable protein phosphatase 2C 33 isoform X1 [Capsicum annuum]XP_047260912.1 probable protein phosphatase 2C 33 isoform X1 [Capsicum annuum]XP_047260913.1 probable protein phosphatase 2C 33 isoform X1 [Capsicum annuum]XP_047260914.1 probable protein phosphatase 2C 33 isoform X1 [Capsicum annuum]